VSLAESCLWMFRVRGGHHVDEDVVEQVELHEAVIASDANSPLVLIREKELEISGRVLAAKRQADEIVASARKQAADLIGAAETEGGAGASDREQAINAEAEQEAARLLEEARTSSEALTRQAEVGRADATRVVLEVVAEV
jgi:cell division septum initiation protein DivIVA